MSRDIDWWENFWKDHVTGFGSPRASLLKFAETFLLNHPHATAIDIASGDGRYAIPLATMGYTVDAMEYTRSGVALIKKRAQEAHVGIHVFQGDFTKESVPDKQYDLVFSSGLLEELLPKFQTPSIKKFMQWTKPGGLDIIKYCVWIEGRGDLTPRGLGLKMYKKAGWNILYTKGADEEEKAKEIVRFDESVRSEIKTETIIALNE